jgi:aldehyde dehydrogenase
VKQWPLIFLGSRPFRYFASVIRAEESSIAELDSQTVTIALSSLWGDCADYSLELPNINGDLETGSGISCRKYSSSKTSRKYANLYFSFDGIDGDILPPGVVNIVNGFGAELGRRW